MRIQLLVPTVLSSLLLLSGCSDGSDSRPKPPEPSPQYDFSALDDFFPHRFEFELPGEGSSVKLEFSDLETNGVLRQGIFKLAPPQGAKVVYMPEVFVPD